jgi:hypothetical protein
MGTFSSLILNSQKKNNIGRNDACPLWFWRFGNDDELEISWEEA